MTASTITIAGIELPIKETPLGPKLAKRDSTLEPLAWFVNIALEGRIQLHLGAILAVKNGPGYALYEQVRKIDAAAKAEGRPLTATEMAERERLVTAMTALYDQAFEESRSR